MKHNARIALISGVAAALLVGAGACASSSGSSGTSKPPSSSAPSSASAPAASTTITITNFTFTGPTTVSAGATVTVTNSDSVDHTVTSDGGQFDVKAPSGQTVTFKAPTAPGTYPFHCSIHPQMHGSLIVK